MSETHRVVELRGVLGLRQEHKTCWIIKKKADGLWCSFSAEKRPDDRCGGIFFKV